MHALDRIHGHESGKVWVTADRRDLTSRPSVGSRYGRADHDPCSQRTRTTLKLFDHFVLSAWPSGILSRCECSTAEKSGRWGGNPSTDAYRERRVDTSTREDLYAALRLVQRMRMNRTAGPMHSHLVRISTRKSSQQPAMELVFKNKPTTGRPPYCGIQLKPWKKNGA